MKTNTAVSVCVWVCVWEMDANSLIALLASPPLLTPLHIQLQAFFPPPLHPSRPRAKKAALVAKSGQDGGFIVGLQRALVLEDEDRGSRPSPRPKTLIWLASQPTKGPSWLGTTSGQEGRSWRLEVSAAVMAVARLRPSLRIGTMEKVYSEALCRHTHTCTHTQRLYSASSMLLIRGRKAWINTWAA